MAGKIVINGRETGKPGVYAIPEFLRLQSRPPLSSILAIIGELPFLEKATPYLSTYQAAFDALSFSSETRKRLSNIIFDASDDPAVQSSPAGVYLVNTAPVTQAFGYLQSSAPANVIKLLARQWGLEGNRTHFSIVQNSALGGWNFTARNGSYVESNVRIKSEPNLLNLEYATPGTPTIPTGFGTSGGAEAGAVTLENTDGDVDVKFTVTIDDANFKVAGNTDNSWVSQAPVDGILVFTPSDTPLIDTGKSFVIKVTGVDKATGLVDTETITWTEAEWEAATPSSSVASPPTKQFTGPVTVIMEEATAVTATGKVVITGKVFPTFNAAAGYTYVASVIAHIANYSASGFTVTTDSTKAASTKLEELDDLSADTLPASLTANLHKIISTINSKSLLVTAERVGDAVPAITTTATSFFLAGGTETSASASDWEESLEELRWYDVDVIAPLYDPTGVDAGDDTILPKFIDHLNTMWSDGANERVAWLPAGDDENLTELVARANQFSDYRVSIPVDGISMVQYNNQVEQLTPHWNAVLMAAMDASTNGLIPLTWRSPRITDFYRNSALYTQEVTEEMLSAGLVYFFDPPGSNPVVQRDITTFNSEDDPRRTERVAVRSLMLSLKFMRTALRRYIVSPDGSIATLADIRSGVVNELERQRNFQIFKSFDPQKVVINPFADRYEVEYEFVPKYPINFIVLRAKVTAPVPIV